MYISQKCSILTSLYAFYNNSFQFQFSQSWSSLGYILPILSFAIIYNIPKFFEPQVKTEQLNGSEKLNNEEDYDFSDTFSSENNETITSEHDSSAFHNLTLVSFDTLLSTDNSTIIYTPFVKVTFMTDTKVNEIMMNYRLKRLRQQLLDLTTSI